MFMSVAGVPIDAFTRSCCRSSSSSSRQGPLAGKAIDPYAIYGAQSAQIVLDAIAASDGSREDVIAKMFETEVEDGLLGDVRVQRERRPDERVGRGRRLHDVHGHRQARDVRTTSRRIRRPSRPQAPRNATQTRRGGRALPSRPFRFRVATPWPRRPRRCSVFEARASSTRSGSRSSRSSSSGSSSSSPEDPTRFLNVSIIGATERRDLRPRRARVHARLRHPPAHQLRPRRRLRAVGPRREHDDPLGLRPRRRTPASS